MSKFEAYYSRQWLNLVEGRAHILCSVSAPVEHTRYRDGYLEATVTVADCDRVVNLELSFLVYEEDDRKNAYYKIDTMIAELQKMRAAMAEAETAHRVQIEQWKRDHPNDVKAVEEEDDL